MKILVIGHSYGLDGAAMLLKKCARHWVDDLGWRVDGLKLTETDAFQIQEMVDHGITPLANANPNDYDLVFVNTLLVMHTIAQVKLEVPAVLWVHEGETVLHNYTGNLGQWSATFAKYSQIIFQTRWQSDVVYKSLVYKIPPERIKIIPNGVRDLSAWLPKTPKPTPQSETKVITLGSLTSRKRPQDVAIAVAQLAQSLAISVDFVGDMSRLSSIGEDFIRYKEKNLPCHHWIGPLKPEAALTQLAQADLYCSPSADESYPLAPMEAAALRVPIVMTDLAPYPYIGWQHEHNCLLYPVGDIPALQNALRRMATEPALRQRLIDNAWEFVSGRAESACIDSLTEQLKQLG